MSLKFSEHSSTKHWNEKWNSATIKQLIENDELSQKEYIPGNTADVICGYAPDGLPVGLIVSKEKNGDVVIITGFSAPIDYWESV